MITRRKLLLAGVSLLAMCRAAMGGSFAIFQADTIPVAAQVSQSWQTLLVGGGGFMTGIDITPDGTMLARSDTPPAPYLWNASQNKWIPLAIATALPGSVVSPRSDKSVGCLEARICPSLTSKIYWSLSGNGTANLFLSTNSGVTSSLLTFPGDLASTDANGTYRSYGYKMAVDPNNDAICYIGSGGTGAGTGGLWFTTNSGGSWTQVSTSSIPVSTTSGAPILIAFDPNSSHPGNVTQTIYVASYGNGVYQTTNGGTTWTKLNTTGMPTLCPHLVVDQNGVLYAPSTSDGFTGTGIFKWTSGGGWVNIGVSNDQAFTIAIDPANALNMIVIGQGGRMIFSNDGGVSWPMDTHLSATFSLDGTGDALWNGTPYTQSGGSYGLTSGHVVFNPTQSHVCYYSWGFGIMECTFPTVSASATVSWHAQSRGISGLDGFDIIHAPTGNPGTIIGSAYDLETWSGLSTTTYVSKYGPTSAYNGPQPNGGAHRCRSIDYAHSSSPSTIVACGGGGLAAFSSNAGSTWTVFPDQTPFANADNEGAIAASTSSNFIAYSSSANLYFTTNTGTSWTAATYGGNLSNGGKVICADSVTANVFYAYSIADGVYQSTNSGQNWTKISSFTLLNEEFVISLKGVPGKAGHLFISTGFSDSGTPPFTNSGLSFSTNAGAGIGATFTNVPGFNETYDMDFGTTVAGQSYPTIYVAGWYTGTVTINGVPTVVSQQIGVFMCQNFNSSNGNGTWVLLGGTGYPEGWYPPIAAVAGDPYVDGACSIAFANGGFKRFA